MALTGVFAGFLSRIAQRFLLVFLVFFLSVSEFFFKFSLWKWSEPEEQKFSAYRPSRRRHYVAKMTAFLHRCLVKQSGLCLIYFYVYFGLILNVGDSKTTGKAHRFSLHASFLGEWGSCCVCRKLVWNGVVKTSSARETNRRWITRRHTYFFHQVPLSGSVRWTDVRLDLSDDSSRYLCIFLFLTHRLVLSLFLSRSRPSKVLGSSCPHYTYFFLKPIYFLFKIILAQMHSSSRNNFLRSAWIFLVHLLTNFYRCK